MYMRRLMMSRARTCLGVRVTGPRRFPILLCSRFGKTIAGPLPGRYPPSGDHGGNHSGQGDGKGKTRDGAKPALGGT